MQSEAATVRTVYEQRDSNPDLWHPLSANSVYYRQTLERALVDAINSVGPDLPNAEILDIGCGDGGQLRFLASLGADPARLHGVDLVPGRIAEAVKRSPHIDFQVADGEDLPFGDASFDVVAQFTAASASPNRTIVAEMRRLVRPGGLILWFDITQPGEPYHAISEQEAQALFAGFRVEFRRPLYHRWTPHLARFPLVCAGVERLALNKTNLLMVLRAPG